MIHMYYPTVFNPYSIVGSLYIFAPWRYIVLPYSSKIDSYYSCILRSRYTRDACLVLSTDDATRVVATPRWVSEL